MSDIQPVSVPAFVLTPPEVIQPLTQEVAKSAVPLQPEIKTAVDDQVERFMHGLLSEDLQSAAFKSRLGSAFALGREEISVASSLMQGQLMQRNFAGVEDSGAFKAIQDMLTQQAVCTNGYLALDVLKKTGREMVNGCSCLTTTGMSALAVAQIANREPTWRRQRSLRKTRCWACRR